MKGHVIMLKRLKNTNHCWEPIIKVVDHLFSKYELVKEEFNEDGSPFRRFYEYEPYSSTRYKNVEDVPTVHTQVPTSPSEGGVLYRNGCDDSTPRPTKRTKLNEASETHIHVTNNTGKNCCVTNVGSCMKPKDYDQPQGVVKVSANSAGTSYKYNCQDGWILLPPNENSSDTSRKNLSEDSSPPPLDPRQYTSRIARLVQSCPNCKFMIRVGDCIIIRRKNCWEHAVCPDASML